mgnify:FL=1
MKKKPSILDMVTNFAKETIEYAKQGAPNVTEESYKKRLETCSDCEHLRRKVMRCGMCGCLVEQKAKWATAKCPDDRWAKEKVGSGGKTITLKQKQVMAKRRKRNNGAQGNTTETSD